MSLKSETQNPQAKVLIVDDEKSIRRTLGEFLRAENYTVIEAEDADTALQHLREAAFDVVVTDIILPRVNGVELLRRIRATDPHVHVVMMTGEPTVDTATEALRTGAADYLYKPISKSAILRAVAGVVRLKSLEDQKRLLEVENQAHRENLECLVSERTQQLRASEERYRGLVETAFDWVWEVDAQGRYTYVGPQVLDMLGYRPEELIGRTPFDLMPEAEALRVRSVFEQVMARRESFAMLENTNRHRDGRLVVLETSGTPMLSASGVLLGYHGMDRDITERKCGEAIRETLHTLAAQLSEARSPLEVARDIFAKADRLWQWDAGVLDILLPGGDLVETVLCCDVVEGKRREVSPTNPRGERTPRVRRILAHGAELILRRESDAPPLDSDLFGDTTRPSASLMNVPIHWRDQAVGILSVQSYTPQAFTEADLRTLQSLADHCGGALERIRAEGAQQAEHTLLRTLVDHLPVAVYAKDTMGRKTLVNPMDARNMGLDSGDAALGKTDFDFFPREQALGFQNVEQQVLRTGQPLLNHEELITRRDGSTAWLLTSKVPLHDAAGHVTGLVGIGLDVTEKKLAEAKFLRAQRVESIGSLASGIAHDLNNILSPILMCPPLLDMEETAEGRRKLTRIIESSAQRAVGIVKQLLSFARGKEGRKQPVQVRHIVRDMATIVRETFPRSIQVKEVCASNLWPVPADATHIHQVLLNLCVNARDAMPSGGTLTLRASNVVLDEHFVSMNQAARPGPHLRLEVEDTGTGIPDDVRERIFESFFTTKGEDLGTGLGLATVKGIVLDHMGFITFRTTQGKGTTFEIHLPAAPEETAEMTHIHPCQVIPPAHGELILVVDDEPAICDTTRRTLERQGYTVLQARDGIQALAQFTSHQPSVRAVVTDYMMPLMDGVTLARILRGVSPHTPIVVSSGGLFGRPGSEALRAFADLDIRHILHKPHTADLLLQTLAQVLHRDEAASTESQSPTSCPRDS